jgi:hypothetical protein
MRALRTLIASTALASAIAAPARAQDFVITLPVQVTKLPPNVKSLSVYCEVGAAGAMGPAIVTVGKGTSAPQAIGPSAAWSGDVTVPVNALAGRDRAQATRYHCWLYFTAPDPARNTSVDYFRWDDPTLGNNPPRPFATAAGAALVLEATGTVPP